MVNRVLATTIGAVTQAGTPLIEVTARGLPPPLSPTYQVTVSAGVAAISAVAVSKGGPSTRIAVAGVPLELHANLTTVRSMPAKALAETFCVLLG